MFLQLEKYHEQAQLLDPHVGPIVEQLTRIIRREALSSSGADWGAFREASTFLWALITVRCSARLFYPPDCLPDRPAHFLALDTLLDIEADVLVHDRRA